MPIRPTIAEIDLNALRHNFRWLKTQLPAEVGWIPMVKADAYGHGARPVSRVLREEGVQALGVSLLEEARELREAGDRGPILIFGTFNNHADLIIRENLTPVLSSFEQMDALVSSLRSPLSVHLKINTGMNRLGFSRSELPELLRRLRETPFFRVEAVMTHLHSGEDADVADGETERQFRLFEELAPALHPDPRHWHIWSTSALMKADSLRDRLRRLGGKAQDLMGARPGLALYGATPSEVGASFLRPVMSVRSRLVKINLLQKGDSVGYGATFRATGPTRLAIVPLGYADGYHRSLSNRGHVLIGGRRAPVVGRVSMDMITVDVTSLPEARVGTEVLIFGKDSSGHRLDVREVAEAADTAAWEILTHVSKRVPRDFQSGASS